MAITSNKFSSRWRFLVALLLFVGVAIFTFVRHHAIQQELDQRNAMVQQKSDLLNAMYQSSNRYLRILANRPLTDIDAKDIGKPEIYENRSPEQLLAKYHELSTRFAAILQNQSATQPRERELARMIATSESTISNLVKDIHNLRAKSFGTQDAKRIAQYTGLDNEKSIPAEIKMRRQELEQAENEIDRLVNHDLYEEHGTYWLFAIRQAIDYQSEIASNATNIASQKYEESRKQMVWMFLAIIVLSVLALWSPLTQMVTQSRA